MHPAGGECRIRLADGGCPGRLHAAPRPRPPRRDESPGARRRLPFAARRVGEADARGPGVRAPGRRQPLPGVRAAARLARGRRRRPAHAPRPGRLRQDPPRWPPPDRRAGRPGHGRPERPQPGFPARGVPARRGARASPSAWRSTTRRSTGVGSTGPRSSWASPGASASIGGWATRRRRPARSRPGCAPATPPSGASTGTSPPPKRAANGVNPFYRTSEQVNFRHLPSAPPRTRRAADSRGSNVTAACCRRRR